MKYQNGLNHSNVWSRWAKAGPQLLLLMACVACGGGSGTADTTSPATSTVPAVPVDLPTEPAVLPLAIGGTVLVIKEGLAFYAPPGISVYSATERLPAYEGPKRVAKVLPVQAGVVTLLSDGSAFSSPDGLNLGGGGNSQAVYEGSKAIRSIFPINGGVLTQFDDGQAYYSPDGLALAGGGSTTLAYGGAASLVKAVGIAGGVLSQFDDGQAYYSQDAQNIGGGGATVLAHPSGLTVEEVRVVEGGVMTWLSDGSATFSPDGQNLGGGGRSIPAVSGTWSKVNAAAPFGPRDSGLGAVFMAEWWFGGGFYRSGPDTSYFDLWRSADQGLTWTLAFGTPTPQTGTRSDHYDPYSPLVNFRGELWAIGSTVWASSDGVNWAQRSAQGPARAREDVRVLVVNDRLVYVDPQNGAVYTSSNGLDWSAGVDITGFGRRCGAVIAALPSGRIVITGGGACDYSGYFHDTWVSDDAVTWRQVTDSATGLPVAPPWSERMWSCGALSASGVLWMAGGFRINDDVQRNFADVWYSLDGIDWRPVATRDTLIEPRHAPTCIFSNEEQALYVMAGKGGDLELNQYSSVRNDVNKLSLPSDAQIFGAQSTGR